MKNIQKNTIPKHRKLHLIFRFLQGSKLYFAAAVAASLVSTILNALTPQIFRFSIDEVLSGSSGTISSSGTSGSYLSSHLWVLALMIVAVAIASGIFTYISRTNTARAGENFAKNLRDTLFIHVQKLPMRWHDRNQTGDIIQRCTSDVEVIRGFVVTQLLEVFRTAFLVLHRSPVRAGCCGVLHCVLPADSQAVYHCGRGRGRTFHGRAGECNRSARGAGIRTGTI